MAKIINPEYAALVELEIASPGPMNWFDFTPEVLKEVASSYDPDELKAPVVLDHMESGPAYGHVLSMDIRDDPDDKGEMNLVATAGVFQTGLSLIESGAWPERSVMISRWHPYDGVWYLNHLSLLGAGNPAVTAMGPVIILDEEDNMQAASDIPTAIAASVTSRRRWGKDEDFIRYKIRNDSRFRDPEKFVTEPIDEGKGIFKIQGKLKSSYLPEGFNTNDIFVHAILFTTAKWDLTRAKKWVASNEKKFKREGARTVMDNDETVKAEKEKLAAKTKELDDRETAIKGREEEVASERETIEQEKIAARVESLREAGKILPAQIELKPVDIAMSIPADAMIGDVTARDKFFEFINAGTVKVPDKKEVSGGDGTTKTADSSNFKVGADPTAAQAAGLKIVDGSDVVLARYNELLAEKVPSSEAIKRAQKEFRDGVIS